MGLVVLPDIPKYVEQHDLLNDSELRVDKNKKVHSRSHAPKNEASFLLRHSSHQTKYDKQSLDFYQMFL